MKTLTTAAAIAAVLISAGAAMATPVVPRANGGAPPPSANRGPNGNEQNLQVARRDILRSIDSLSRDANDYGGHRETAMDDLGVARQFLEQAIQYRHSHGGNNRGV